MNKESEPALYYKENYEKMNKKTEDDINYDDIIESEKEEENNPIYLENNLVLF